MPVAIGKVHAEYHDPIGIRKQWIQVLLDVDKNLTVYNFLKDF